VPGYVLADGIAHAIDIPDLNPMITLSSVSTELDDRCVWRSRTDSGDVERLSQN
jgi:hypothetical protein